MRFSLPPITLRRHVLPNRRPRHGRPDRDEAARERTRHRPRPAPRRTGRAPSVGSPAHGAGAQPARQDPTIGCPASAAEYTAEVHPRHRPQVAISDRAHAANRVSDGIRPTWREFTPKGSLVRTQYRPPAETPFRPWPRRGQSWQKVSTPRPRIARTAPSRLLLGCTYRLRVRDRDVMDEGTDHTSGHLSPRASLQLMTCQPRSKLQARACSSSASVHRSSTAWSSA